MRVTHESDDVSLEEAELVLAGRQVGIEGSGERCVPDAGVRDCHRLGSPLGSRHLTCAKDILRQDNNITLPQSCQVLGLRLECFSVLLRLPGSCKAGYLSR